MADPSDVRECGVCWYAYDPRVGDPLAQLPPGTDFEALPPDWRCPRCDAPPERFLKPADVQGPFQGEHAMVPVGLAVRGALAAPDPLLGW